MSPKPASRRLGLSLIELLVALVIVGILAGIAYPSYSSQIAKGRRSDAKQALVELAQRLERYYSENSTYAGATLGNAGIYGTTATGGYYTLAIVSQSATAFAITATPTGTQTADACGSYGYNQAGVKSVSGATLSVTECWN